MNKVLVTGATSFVGEALIKELIKRDCFVFAVCRKNSPHFSRLDFLPKEKIKIVFCDMDSYTSLPLLIPVKIDIFIHLSWAGTRAEARMDEKLQELNFEISRICLSAATIMGASLFVDAGSQAEYGPIGGILSEDRRCEPNTAYGKQKLKFCNFILEQKQIRYIHPRFFSIYGPGDDPATMTMSIVKRMIANEDCYLTLGTQQWNYLYIDDLAKLLTKLIFSNDANGIFNFGGEETRPLKEYVLEMERILASKSRLYFGAVPYPSTGAVSIVPDITKLRKTIPYSIAFSFRRGIKEIERYLEAAREQG